MLDPREVENLIEGGRHLVPPHMWSAVRSYFIDRRPVGDFLTALLRNDLMATLARADDTNTAAIPNWCQFLYNFAPAGSYGSPFAVDTWLGPEHAPAALSAASVSQR